MEKEFIPYEQALDLKELGFDEMCFGWYHHKLIVGNDFYILEFEKSKNDETWLTGKHCSAPLYQQVFRWFREKYGIFSSTWCFETEQKFFIEFGFGIHKFEIDNEGEVELECLKKIIEIIKIKKL